VTNEARINFSLTKFPAGPMKPQRGSVFGG
jgi:hypothetical protein